MMEVLISLGFEIPDSDPASWKEVLNALGFEIPNSDPASGKEECEDCKMVANRKNTNLTKTNKKQKSLRVGQPQGNNSYPLTAKQ